jgi:adenine-specific DNA-methyltransferase
VTATAAAGTVDKPCEDRTVHQVPFPTPLSEFATTEGLLAAVCAALLNDSTQLDAAEGALVGPAAVPAQVLVWARAAVVAGGDPLGDVFCALRSPADRRDLGQFYTPDRIVTAMCSWVLGMSPARAVDGGCGSGRYAVALRRAGFAGDLIAVDVDPLATLMTKAHAAAAGVEVDVQLASFLELELPVVGGRTAWVGNPPYLRHHGLAAGSKAWAKRAAADVGVSVSGLAGLHALFFLAVAANGRPGDVGCFITSSEWFDARYGSVVRDLLTGPTPLVRLDVVPPSTFTFDDAATTAAITSFTVGDEAGTPHLRIVHDPSDLTHLDGGEPLDPDQLSDTTSWSLLLPGAVQAQTAAHLVPLSTHMRVSRGIATGSNKFFVLPKDAAANADLLEHTRPLVSRAIDILTAGGQVTAATLPKVLLDLPTVLPEGDVALAAYVADGAAAGVPDGYLCSHRPQWWRVGVPAPAPIVATYMARQAPVFALNPDGAANLNNCHGLRPVEGFPADLVPVLVRWLNEHRAELVGGRVYAGGLRKVEPRDMEAFMVPDLATLRQLAN